MTRVYVAAWRIGNFGWNVLIMAYLLCYFIFINNCLFSFFSLSLFFIFSFSFSITSFFPFLCYYFDFIRYGASPYPSTWTGTGGGPRMQNQNGTILKRMTKRSFWMFCERGTSPFLKSTAFPKYVFFLIIFLLSLLFSIFSHFPYFSISTLYFFIFIPLSFYLVFSSSS